MHGDQKRTRDSSLSTTPPVLEGSHAKAADEAKSSAGGSLASSLTPDEPHDGRAHSGLSGDDGQYRPADSTATPASLQPGRAADLGKVHDTPYDPMPSPAAAYANTGQANTEPQREAAADNSDDSGVAHPAGHAGGRTTKRAKKGDPRHVHGSFRGG
jgi:hypothetical protein